MSHDGVSGQVVVGLRHELEVAPGLVAACLDCADSVFGFFLCPGGGGLKAAMLTDGGNDGVVAQFGILQVLFDIKGMAVEKGALVANTLGGNPLDDKGC